MRLDADTLVMKAQGMIRPVAIPLTSVKRLEVSRGRKSRILKGLGIGFLVGAGLGAYIGAAKECNGTGGDTMCGDRAANAVFAGSVLGLLGAVAGTIVGVAAPGESWEEVPLEKVSLLR